MRLARRYAQNRWAKLEYFDDSYFQFLKECGMKGLYLQNSPYDPISTGNKAQFYHHFHLISLFDIAYSQRSQEYQDYINEICNRADQYGLEVWLDCWEPRLPDYARSQLPISWRGKGGWGWHGNNDIAFCWENEAAVKFWKNMVTSAINALPKISGIVLSMIDNESELCDEKCERCHGRSREKGIQDILETFINLSKVHPRHFEVAMYDWWLPTNIVEKVLNILPEGSLMIGRSSRSMLYLSDSLEGERVVQDISNIVDGISEPFKLHCAKNHQHHLVPMDMVAWSRGMENFFLPAPPDPLFALKKLNALHETGAQGWFDYDCGCLEPGSLSEALKRWTACPEESEDQLMRGVVETIWAEDWPEAIKAYHSYREYKKNSFTGLNFKDVAGFDGRSCGLGLIIFAPFHLDDLSFADRYHARNYFAPFNLISADSIPVLLQVLKPALHHLEEAFHRIQGLTDRSELTKIEKASFEIYVINHRSIYHYVSLAKLKWNHQEGNIDSERFLSQVRDLAKSEIENMQDLKVWMNANPMKLGNPCHRVLGHLMEMWPEVEFGPDILAPKMRSLKFLLEDFSPKMFVDYRLVQGIVSDEFDF